MGMLTRAWVTRGCSPWACRLEARELYCRARRGVMTGQRSSQAWGSKEQSGWGCAQAGRKCFVPSVDHAVW